MKSRFAKLGILATSVLAAAGITLGSVSAASPSSPPPSLMNANNAFAYYVFHGEGGALNQMATAQLRAQAPSHQLVNLLHLQNLPSSWGGRVYNATQQRGTSDMVFKFGHTTTITDRLQYIKVGGTWKVSKITYLRTWINPNPISALVQANDGLATAMIHGPDAVINSYATPQLLAKAPARHLVNLLSGGMQNPPGNYGFRVESRGGPSVAVRGRAKVMMDFDNGSVTVRNRLFWTKTAADWKLSNVKHLATFR